STSASDRSGDGGPPARRRSPNTAAVVASAWTVCWSLRFMVVVLLWGTGVVCNYNTTTRPVKHPGTQLMAGVPRGPRLPAGARVATIGVIRTIAAFARGLQEFFPMKPFLRGAAALLLSAAAMALPIRAVLAQDAPLGTERDRASYAVGVDVGRSLQPIAAELDLAALQQEMDRLFAGGKPSLSPEEAQQVDAALRGTLAARNGMPGAPESPPAVDRARVGQLVGGYIVGPSLLPIHGELDMALLMRGMRDASSGGSLLMPADDVQQVLNDFGERVRAKA